MDVLTPLVVVNGYYGFSNYGDELLLGVLCHQLRLRGARVLILSADVDDTLARHGKGDGTGTGGQVGGVQAVGRYKVWEVLKALSGCQLFISGGGGLFQDSTGPNSVLFYGGLIMLARLMGKPVAHLFQSIGPLTTGWGHWMTQQALRLSQLVAVRDERSAVLATTLLGHRPLVAADLAWLSDPIIVPPPQWNPAWRIGISLRPHQDLTHERLRRFAQFLLDFTADSAHPVKFSLIPCQWDEDEQPLMVLASYLQELLPSCPSPRPATSWEWVTEDHEAITQALGSSHMVFGMRFHSLVMALRCGVQVFGLVYDPKVSSLLEGLGLQGCPISALDQLNVPAMKTYFNHYPTVDQAPMRDKVTVALNAVAALYL
jgi:polysaccharide pyruvyl transferase CsaB